MDQWIFSKLSKLENVPEKITEYYEGGGSRTYVVYKNWWYFSGPGSMLEIKFTIGGIF